VREEAGAQTEMKQLRKMLADGRRKIGVGWGMSVVAKSRQNNIGFQNPFRDPLPEFSQHSLGSHE